MLKSAVNPCAYNPCGVLRLCGIYSLIFVVKEEATARAIAGMDLEGIKCNVVPESSRLIASELSGLLNRRIVGLFIVPITIAGS